MKGINISFKPTNDQLAEIKKWLIEEEKRTGDGFYCNWEIIESSFAKKNLATISQDEKTIGFITWYNNSNHTSRIDIIEIKPTHRSKGLGKILISKLLEKLRSKIIYAVKLECAPSYSEPIWRHLGFIDFPEHRFLWNRQNKELYKILIPHLETQKLINAVECIELWNDESFGNQSLNSKWKWQLVFKEGTRELVRPIIHPCHDDWRIKWTLNGATIRDDKVKYFDKQVKNFGDFLIINRMPKRN